MTTVKNAKDDMSINHDEAAYVDSQYEYLLKHKDQGITLEDYAKKRGIEL